MELVTQPAQPKEGCDKRPIFKWSTTGISSRDWLHGQGLKNYYLHYYLPNYLIKNGRRTGGFMPY